jgi:hypothetical protein
MIGGGVALELSTYSSGGFGAAQALKEANPDVIISTILAIDVEERKFGNLRWFKSLKSLSTGSHESQRG